MTGDRRNSPRKSSGKSFHKGKGGHPSRREPFRGRDAENVSGSGRVGRSAKDLSEKAHPPITSDEQVTEGRYAGCALAAASIDGSVPVAREVREEFFKNIGKRVRAARFLDLCAGTGMIGIEAVSRGALLCTFVERKARRCSDIRKNLKDLGIKDGHGEVFEEEAEGFLKRMSARRRFWDVVFYDPPFDANYADTLAFVGSGAAVRPEGLFVIRHHAEMFFEENLGVLKRRKVIGFEQESLTMYDRKA
jgi:16S rRNA (guanine966-N2)-methyltransferase